MFPDCGIGSDPNATGPCTGTYGPEHLGESVTGVFASGKGQLLSVGAALLAMFAVVVLLNMIRRPLQRDKPKADEGQGAGMRECPMCRDDFDADEIEAHGMCSGCWAYVSGDGGGDGLVERAASLAPGQAFCLGCGADYDADLFDVCPCCGGASEDEPPADAGVCSVCGVVSEELVGDLFPACPDCAAASDAQRAIDEIGPDDEETFGGNPDGVGGGGVRA